MKKLFVITLVALVSLSSVCFAQSQIDAMMQSLSNYYERISSGIGKDSQYEALWNCYTSAQSVIRQSGKGSSSYIQALESLQKIAPGMVNAAAYYQSGNPSASVRFSEAFITIAQMDGMGTRFISSQGYPALAYNATAYNYNHQHYTKAIEDSKAYLKSSDNKHRRDVFECMINSYKKLKQYDSALDVYIQAIKEYPGDYNFLSEAVVLCEALEDYSRMQVYLAKAVAINPNDKKMLLYQGRLYERNSQYDKALEVFLRLQRTNPNDATVVEHLAINTFNMGVINYNNAIMSNDATEVTRLMQISNKYFSQAISPLNSLIAYDSTSLRYTQALAVAYKCTGDKQQMENTNKKLTSLGGGRISDDFVPTLMGEKAKEMVNNTAPAPVSGTPAFSSFAKKYIETVVNAWQQKDQFETPTEYRERVTDFNRNAKIAQARKQAESEYIRTYSPNISASNFSLRPYDAENEAFLVETDFGQQMIVPVPRQNNEAKIFSSGWNGVQTVNPEFCISNDKIALASIVFVTPYGKRYTYSHNRASEYTDVQIDAKFEDIDPSLLTSAPTSSSANKPNIFHKTITVGKSDVDMDIPVAKSRKENTYAVIFANENYQNVAKVPLAINDGTSFRNYCETALGLPKENITFCSDASYGTMLRTMRYINQVASTYDPGEMNVVFYYAGHGIPNEASRQAYLLPVDGDGQSTEICYPVDKLYSELAKTNAGQITVFLDACFSGAQRGEGMLACARGVALKSKPGTLAGNMVVFSAATADETALPYTEKNHGLFTYFLLKKLKESNGDVLLGELSNYLAENVSRQSIIVNSKLQTPVTTPSVSIAKQWRTMKIQ